MSDCQAEFAGLRSEMSHWLAQSRRVDGPGPNGGGEDEANYSLAWFPHYILTGDADVAEHFRALLAALAGWVDRECHHGYEPEAEAHHGTEPFLLFLPRYLGLFPEDSGARGLLSDAARHVGNWGDGVPDWYDYDRDCFHSYRIGSRVVGEDPGEACEVAEHFRFLHIALAAYRVTGEQRYFDWSLRYGAEWARRLNAAAPGPLPVVWTQDGDGVYERDMTPKQRNMSAASHHVEGDPLVGVEVLLASGAIYALGDLFSLTGDSAFHRAARRIAGPLVSQLTDPYADPGAAAVAYYRLAFGDDSLDDDIRAQVDRMPDESPDELAMTFPQERRRVARGVGRRNDMIHWGRRSAEGVITPADDPCTAALALAYQVSGDDAYAARAFRQARVKLTMARRVLRGGREHADMGGAVCSVAAGHGRNWGVGTVTGCYGPLSLGTREVMGRVVPAIEFTRPDGATAMPDDVLSLVRPSVCGGGQASFSNAGAGPAEFSWRASGDGDWSALALQPDESRTVLL
ncbi:hypothetical protein CMK11_11735 [Candidatus Poribacteria bacterium]|nr:hypothetical protein [Candidatus Poribacteria bacterium]